MVDTFEKTLCLYISFSNHFRNCLTVFYLLETLGSICFTAHDGFSSILGGGSFNYKFKDFKKLWRVGGTKSKRVFKGTSSLKDTTKFEKDFAKNYYKITKI